MQGPDSGFDTELFERCKKRLIGRLLPEMGELILGRREQVGVSHGCRTETSRNENKSRKSRENKGKKVNSENGK
jgi:hypothetical protein